MSIQWEPLAYGLTAVAALALVAAIALIRDVVLLRRRVSVLITERDALAREIETYGDQRERAVAASEAKSRFIATVSHEVRTPLNGVLGMADLLRDTRLDAEQQTYVRAIQSSGEALLSLIDEILDFSRVEAGKMEIQHEPVDVRALVEGVVELLAPRAQGKGLEIAVRVAADVPRQIITDPARVRQILMNLGGNAVKFTETGGVGLRVANGPGETLAFTVEDTGPGIPPDRLEAIFSEFEQVDGSAARRHGGTGLGLAISRRLAAALGATLEATSRLGEGATFRFVLPALDAVPMPNASARTRLAGRFVVIVSPGPFAGRFLGEALAERGASVINVGPGAVLSGPDIHLPDMLVIDAALGLEVTRRIAQAPVAASGRRVVLLSPFERRAFGSPAEAGFDTYLVKPIREKSLSARLADFAAPAGEASALPGPANETGILIPMLRGRRVLIAEDNDINALLTRKLIERLGGEPVWARDGIEALELLGRESPDGFAIVLMDVRMPGLDGLEAVRRWRRTEAERGRDRLPIVALTANVFEEDRVETLAAGFDAFLGKPLDREALLSVLRKTLATSRAVA